MNRSDAVRPGNFVRWLTSPEKASGANPGARAPVRTSAPASLDDVALARTRRFRAMMDAHVDRVYRTLRSLGVPVLAVDDAVQHVFLVAFQKLATIEEGRERAFLVGVATGVAANVRRRLTRSPETPYGESTPFGCDDSPSPEEVAIRSERRAALERILRSMPVELREVFVLFELEGLTAQETADALELPPGTVASRLRRARALFRVLLEGMTTDERMEPR